LVFLHPQKSVIKFFSYQKYGELTLSRSPKREITRRRNYASPGAAR